MAEYRTIKNSFWNDPWVENLDDKSKLLYIYLFTNIYVDNAGVMKVSLKRIEFEIGINKEFIYKTLNYFSSEGKIVLIDDFIWVVSFIKHQTSTSPMILKNIAKCLDKINSQDLINTILDKYKTLSIPYQYSNNEPEYPIDIKEEEIEREEEVELEDEKKDELENGILKNWCKKQSSWYHTEIRKIFPNIKIMRDDKIADTIDRGADILRKLHTIDKKPLDEIDSVLKSIIKNNSFWARNIQSLSSIRNVMKNDLMKYEGVLNSMEDDNQIKLSDFRKNPGGFYRGYCFKCGETDYYDKFEIWQDSRCHKAKLMTARKDCDNIYKQVLDQAKEAI